MKDATFTTQSFTIDKLSKKIYGVQTMATTLGMAIANPTAFVDPLALLPEVAEVDVGRFEALDTALLLEGNGDIGRERAIGKLRDSFRSGTVGARLQLRGVLEGLAAIHLRRPELYARAVFNTIRVPSFSTSQRPRSAAGRPTSLFQTLDHGPAEAPPKFGTPPPVWMSPGEVGRSAPMSHWKVRRVREVRDDLTRHQVADIDTAGEEMDQDTFRKRVRKYRDVMEMLGLTVSDEGEVNANSRSDFLRHLIERGALEAGELGKDDLRYLADTRANEDELISVYLLKTESDREVIHGELHLLFYPDGRPKKIVVHVTLATLEMERVTRTFPRREPIDLVTFLVSPIVEQKLLVGFVLEEK